MLGGREITRQLITIGTPYQGSVNALHRVVNGLSVGLGPLTLKLTPFVRSLPSVYQLLPTYPCLDLGDGILREANDTPLPDLEPDRVQAAIAFHHTMAEQIAKG